MLTFAIPKGRILEPLVALLVEGGVKEAQGLLSLERDLVLLARSFGLRFLIVRDRDVPTYIAGGGCDLGVVGSDVLMEQSPDLYELIDLRVGACSLKLAELQELAETDNPSIWTRIRVATKYPRVTQRFFRERGVEVETVTLNGSVELAPIVGLAPRIVDLVSTGMTLKQHGLVPVIDIMECSARLVANKAAFRMKKTEIERLYLALRGAKESLNAKV
jgi:ATP phosphoribosyltransferase